MPSWKISKLTPTMVRHAKKGGLCFVSKLTVKCDVCGKLMKIGEQVGNRPIRRRGGYKFRCLEHYNELFSPNVRSPKEQEEFMKTETYQNALKKRGSKRYKPNNAKKPYATPYTEEQYLKVQELVKKGYLNDKEIDQMTGVRYTTVSGWRDRSDNPFAEGRWVTVNEQ